MPAKQKFLPEPCPICRKGNGTIQVGLLDELRFRVGHYDKEKYKQTKKIYKKPFNELKKGFGTEGKIWHNFRINYLRTKENLIDEGLFTENQLKKKTSISLSTNEKFCNLIKERGWHALPSNPENKRKNFKNNRIKYNVKRYRTPFEKENESLINLINETLVLFQKHKSKIIKTMAAMTDKELKSYNKLFLQLNLIKSQEPSLKPLYVIPIILKFISGIYFTRVKKLTPLSQKHIKRIVTGRIRNLHPLIDPKNCQESISAGFYGLQCPNCGSWRVDKAPDGPIDNLYCWACDSNFRGKRI